MATNRPRIYGECSNCQRRFNYLAPVGGTWSGKCVGCGMPVTATLAGSKPAPQTDPTTRKSAIPKAEYRQKKKVTDDAPKGPQDSTAGDGGDGASGAPPVPPTDGEPSTAHPGGGTGEPPAEPAGEPPGLNEHPGADEEPTGEGKRRSGKPVRHGNYSHLGYPY